MPDPGFNDKISSIFGILSAIRQNLIFPAAFRNNIKISGI
jgi:superfamily II DNA/RNA helicase